MKLLFLLFLLLCNIIVIAQQPGTLDPSFGNKGIIIDETGTKHPSATLTVTQKGTILSGSFGPYKGFKYTFRIDALLPDGSPDVSFGESGSTHVIFPGMIRSTDMSSVGSLALLPNGKILASGSLLASGTDDDIAFARLNPDGTLDSSFGNNGTITTTFGYTNEGSGNLTLQPDGKFIVGGSATIDEFQNIDKFFTARFLPDGSKDKSYGNGGMVLSNNTGAVSAIALQEDGKIVAAGYYGNDFGENAAFYMERYNADGSYDNSFDANGIVYTNVEGKPCVINDVAIQEDGKIVVAGRTGGFDDEPVFTIARYNSNGSLDQGFGKEGIVATHFSQYGGEGKKLWLTGQQGDKIVVAGINVSYFENHENFAVVGYNTDGSLDPEFGNKGIRITDLGGIDDVSTATLQSDGKIIVAGYTQSLETFETNSVLTRYQGYPTRVPLYVRIKRWLQNHGISWKGLSAQDNIAYYSVERSADGKTGYTQIAKVSGITHLSNYNITSSQLLPGTNYYRIKAVSTDGTIRYSEVVAADNTAATASIYPNPVRDYVTVQGLQSNEAANISIANSSGTVVARGVSSGSTQYRTAAGNLQRGTYYLHITTRSGKRETLQFVKE